MLIQNGSINHCIRPHPVFLLNLCGIHDSWKKTVGEHGSQQNQWWFSAGPASLTVEQHKTNIASMSHVCPRQDDNSSTCLSNKWYLLPHNIRHAFPGVKSIFDVGQVMLILYSAEQMIRLFIIHYCQNDIKSNEYILSTVTYLIRGCYV